MITSTKVNPELEGDIEFKSRRTALSIRGADVSSLRVWANSPDGYHNFDRVLHMARRIKDCGLKLLIDFHYSDSWADPGKQIKPAAGKITRSLN